MKWVAYWRLLRLDKPIGIALLWYPTAWALWVANQGHPSFKNVSFFALGTVLMRSAGCVVNDMADRRLDIHVARTKKRPLASGEITCVEAFLLLAIVLVMALMILIQLPLDCVVWAILALLLTGVYPLCKRLISAPQLVLGLTFSMGIPMAFVAQQTPMGRSFFILFLINFLWIVAYDTMYAMTDKQDDLKVGIKSSAIYFGGMDCFIIGMLQVSLHVLWLYLGHLIHVSFYFYIFWLLAIVVPVYQQKLIGSRNPMDCFKAFLISSYYGALMWGALIFA